VRLNKDRDTLFLCVQEEEKEESHIRNPPRSKSENPSFINTGSQGNRGDT